MPATFPSHAAAVLPFKIRWPAAFNGMALVIGSTTPDQAYAIYGRFHLAGTHQWPGLLWWCLPMTLIETWLVRRAVPIVAAHLPDGGLFALRAYGAAGRRRHHWYVTIFSALLGAASHLVWDGLAHRPASPGWGRNLLPFLNTPSINAWSWWGYAELTWSLGGGFVALLMCVKIGRTGLVRQWYGTAPPVRRLPTLFWTIVVGFLAVYPLTYSMLGYKHALHVQGIRVMWLIALGLLTAAGTVALVNRVRRPRPRRGYSPPVRHREGLPVTSGVGAG